MRATHVAPTVPLGANGSRAAGAEVSRAQEPGGTRGAGRRLIAICPEGPLFRQDAAAKAFRPWLEEIGADTMTLPGNSARESGAGLACRIIFAAKPEAPTAARQTRPADTRNAKPAGNTPNPAYPDQTARTGPKRTPANRRRYARSVSPSHHGHTPLMRS